MEFNDKNTFNKYILVSSQRKLIVFSSFINCVNKSSMQTTYLEKLNILFLFLWEIGW